MSFWGYKFEALSTLPSNWDDCSREQIENRDEEIVSNEAQFCSIVKTGFADVKIVIGGEVDAGTSPFPHPYLQMLSHHSLELESPHPYPAHLRRTQNVKVPLLPPR